MKAKEAVKITLMSLTLLTVIVINCYIGMGELDRLINQGFTERK